MCYRVHSLPSQICADSVVGNGHAICLLPSLPHHVESIHGAADHETAAITTAQKYLASALAPSAGTIAEREAGVACARRGERPISGAVQPRGMHPLLHRPDIGPMAPKQRPLTISHKPRLPSSRLTAPVTVPAALHDSFPSSWRCSDSKRTPGNTAITQRVAVPTLQASQGISKAE